MTLASSDALITRGSHQLAPTPAGPMAASEDGSGCLVSRGRSQSDPSVLTDSSATSSADAGENPGNGVGGGGRGGPGQGALGAKSRALLRAGAAFAEPRQDPVAQAPHKAAEPFVRGGAGSPGRARHSASALLAGWWDLLAPPRGFPSLGADQLGAGSQTCGRLYQRRLRALLPSPAAPAPVAQEARLGHPPPGQGSAYAAAAQRGSAGRPSRRGLAHLGAPARLPGQVCWQSCHWEMKGMRAPGRSLISLNYMDFVHSPTPRGSVDCLGDKSGHKGVYTA